MYVVKEAVKQEDESRDLTPVACFPESLDMAKVFQQWATEQLGTTETQYEIHTEPLTFFDDEDVELICDSITNLIMLSSAGGIGECGLDDETLVQLWQLFERIDPTESNHAAHLRDCLRDHTNFFADDDPVIGDEG